MPVITYNELHRIITESIGFVLTEALLTESQESKSISDAVKLYMRQTGKDYENANNFIRLNIRAKFPALRSKQGGKFILGVTRMRLEGDLSSPEIEQQLGSVLKYVCDPTHINQYDRNLNDLSAEELIYRFAGVRTQDMEKDKQEIGAVQREARSEYQVIPINSFNEIRKYGSYNDWCLSQSNGENMYDEYTKGGINQLYLILRDGFEKEPRHAGPDAPYDSYGLSMMTVIVDPEGQMVQSTTRWNHENGSSDSAFTPKQMSDIIGRNFYEVFKPNTKFKDALSSALMKCADGVPPIDVFDEYVPCRNAPDLVCLRGRWNAIDSSGNLISKMWYSFIQPFSDGFALIMNDALKYNFIDVRGKLLSNKWYELAKSFHEGAAVVYISKKGFNAIDKNGELISHEYFSNMASFQDGLSTVEKTWVGVNYMTLDGRLLFKEWLDDGLSFVDGLAVVRKDGKYNIADIHGGFLSDIWFDDVDRLFRHGWNAVYIAGKGGNYIDREGRFLLNPWADDTSAFMNGYGKVTYGNKQNLIDSSGNYISDTWYDSVSNFVNGAAIVYRDGKCNYIDGNGRLISDTWFARVRQFDEDGTAKVIANDGSGAKLRTINRNGEFVGK